MAKKIDGGYIAISRGIFEHPLLRKPQWFMAWQWMIAHAAWRTTGTRLKRGVTGLKRGQIAITVRGLAETWGWSKSNVEYFLDRMEAAQMISRERIQTDIQTSIRSKKSYSATRITICNYDKFQAKGKAVAQPLGQEVKHESGQLWLHALVEQTVLATNHTNHLNHSESNEDRGTSSKRKPFDGATNGKMVWADYKSALWHQYATDYEEVHGAVRKPDQYLDGLGAWFYKLGEALNPKNKRMRA